ncbi:GNAT family N-acetyltransferase [Halobacillus amylolyticus]|uniref:GNAT family N-acetyltransferase n=1 Tax=Halobacillus amylolyticus TaxID=2932259 RepID=A0ABY4HG50_9BACI|nr:GNAT family N-acetyltransferase [Halobacillus amylolyticus]UOR13263.1 GNAT family N-acetyltransferase [Halobacillus amylolyticus]
MDLIVKNMNETLATQILTWNYEGPYDFYNNELSDEEIRERLNGTYKALIDENGEVLGFFCTGDSAQVPIGKQYGAYFGEFVDMGLGMNPNYVGKGNGYNFCSFIIQHIKENTDRASIRLTVATFNKRAIHLYKKLGFVKKDKFTTDFAEFITMVKKN